MTAEGRLASGPGGTAWEKDFLDIDTIDNETRVSLAHKALILVVGTPGTGKSTLSRGILRRVNATLLDNNFIADGFFPDTRVTADYQAMRQGFYNILHRIAVENLKVENSVLLDVPHVLQMKDAKWREFITGLAQENGAELVVIRCYCSEASLLRRLQARGEPRDRWKLENWECFLRREPLRSRISLDHIEINTDDELSTNIRGSANFIFYKTDTKADISQKESNGNLPM